MPMTYDLNLREYWRTIRKRKFIVIYTVVMLTAFSFITSILGRPTPVYQTSASVKVEKMGSVTGLYLEAVSWSSTNYMETQMAMIKSYFILELVAKKMGRIPADLASEEVRNNPGYLTTILDLKERIKTEQEGNSDIINITVTSPDPVEAQHLANTVAQVYQERHGLELNRRIIEAKKFIEGQLAVTHEKLRKSEEAIRDFRQANRMVSLDSQSSALVGQLAALQTAHERDLATLDRMDQIGRLLARAEDSPLSSKTVFYFEEASAPYKGLNDRLVQMMLERDLLLINYTDDFPQVVEIKKQIREIVTGLRSQLETQRQSLSQTIELTRRQIRQMDGQLATLPTKGLELARLERDAGINKELYTQLEKQHQESQIQHAEKLEEVQIVKPALKPDKPVNPPKTAATTALGFLIGLVLGVVFAFVIETFDTSIGAVEEVEEFLGARVLGVIPHIDFEELKITLKEKLGKEIDHDQLWRIGRLISHFAPKTTSAESYRALRTNINFVKLEKNVKTIVVTSSSPQEGKTTVAINLAITMAQEGKRVLLIDGDFRRPVVSKIFGIPSVPGLTDVILGNYKWRDVVRSITDIMMGQMTASELTATPGLDNLFILTSGTISPNPAELVSTKINADVIQESHEAYDFVIIDAPPVLAATDAAIWGTRADGVIIIYQVGKIARGALKRAKAQIDNVKASIIGVVLNGLKAEISPDYDYHDKYYYYYGSERKKTLTLGQGILSLPERVSQYIKALSGKGENAGREKETSKQASTGKSGRSNVGSKMVLLILALGLLGYGFYYVKVMNNSIQAPDWITDIIPKLWLEKVQKNPTTAVASKPAISSGSTKPFSPQGSSIIEEKKGFDKEEAPPPASNPTGLPDLPDAAPSEQKISDQRESPPSPASHPAGLPDLSYTVQVEAIQYLQGAGEKVEALKSKGYDAHKEMVDLKQKGVWYRIYIGRFASEKEARRYILAEKIEAIYPDCMIRRLENRNQPSEKKSVPQ